MTATARVCGVAVLVVTLVVGCATSAARRPMAEPGMPRQLLDGTIVHRTDGALAPGAVVKIWLQDVSRTDVPAFYVDEVEIRGAASFPIAFQVRYDPAQIDPRHVYTLLVKIYEGDRTRYLNATRFPVLTQGGCVEQCRVVVDRMN
ncbi:MAG: YbaY family lipoprotein [Burkholderiales bacterium]|nr:YbaY family lipoprotein [Burkholderiales bacterium]